MRKHLVVMALLVLLLSGWHSHVVYAAEVYQWVDRNGVVHLSDTPPQNMTSVKKVERIITPKTSPPPGAPSEQKQEAAPKDQPSPVPQESSQVVVQSQVVELYTSSWCPYCRKAKQYLDGKGIAYKEYNIELDNNAMKRKQALAGNSGVPVAVINGQVIRGFSASAYDHALGLQP